MFLFKQTTPVKPIATPVQCGHMRTCPQEHLQPLLQQAHRQGLLIVGTKKTIDLVEKLPAICLSQNAGTQTRDRFVSGNWPDKTFILPLSSGQIGALFARGPRTVVGIRSGRTTQSLLEGLRMWDSLG